MASELVKELRQIPLFSELNRTNLNAVAKLVKRGQYPKGYVIGRQGQPGHTAYIVESGKLRATYINPQGHERTVAYLKPGDFFGQSSLLLGEPHDATVEVIEDATLAYIDKSGFDDLTHEHPEILDQLNMRSDVAEKRWAKRMKWQDPEEIVVKSLHKHNALLVRNLIFPIFVISVSVAAGTYFSYLGPFILLPVGLLTLLALLFSTYLVINHFNDDYVVTNQRVVHEERVPLIRESRAEAPLRTIQNVQQLQEGILAQWFEFGDLIIETAGERGHIVFRKIPHPAEVQNAIFEQMHRVQAVARAEERAAIRDALQEQFGPPPPRADVEGDEEAGEQRGSRFKVPSWLRSVFEIINYFVPPLRYEQGETITWRKHWVALIKPVALPTALIVLLTGIAIFWLSASFPQWKLILITYGIAMILILPWWIWKFDDWKNDLYQVTSTRIIDIERLPFYLREERREASLGMIQNINLEIPGIVGRILNFGSVTIETAGAGAFTFPYIKDPHQVQTEIFRRMEAFQNRQRQEEAERHRNELLDWFTVYAQLHRNQRTAPESSDIPQQET